MQTNEKKAKMNRKNDSSETRILYHSGNGMKKCTFLFLINEMIILLANVLVALKKKITKKNAIGNRAIIFFLHELPVFAFLINLKKVLMYSIRSL